MQPRHRLLPAHLLAAAVLAGCTGTGNIGMTWRNCSGSRCDPAVVGRPQSCLAAWSADATVDPADGLTTPAITSKAGAAGTRASKAVLPLMVAATTRVRRRTWQGLRWAPSA